MPPTARARPGRALVARRRWPLAVLAAAVAVAVVVPGSVAARAARSADEGARRAATALDAAQRGVRVTTNSADDAAAQQASASAALDRVLGGAGVVDTRLTYPLDAHPADDPTGAARAVVLAHVADWADRVDLVDGREPRPGDTVEVVAPAAAGIATGQRLVVGSARLPVEVVGTWRPRDPADPLWFADPGLADGTLSDRRSAVGPLFTADDAAVDRAADRPLVRWTVAPPAARLTAADLARLADGLRAMPDALAAAGAIVQGSTVEADGGPALAAIADEALAARRHADAALGVGLGAGVLGLLAAAATVEVRTRRERERLLARGARRGRLVRRDAPGVLLAAGLGGALGWALAAAAAVAGGISGGSGGLGGPGGLGGSGGAVPAAVAGALATLAACLRRLPVDAARARSRGALTGALVAVLVAGTGLAVWRRVRAPGEPDVAAQAAPLLLLVCAGLLVGLATARTRGASAARGGSGPPGPRPPAPQVNRTWLLPAVAALAGGAVGYATQAHDATLRTAWATAAAGTLLVAVLTLVADAVARRQPAEAPQPAPRPATPGAQAGAQAGTLPAGGARVAAGLAAAVLVACVLGAGVALATAGLVVGSVP